MYFALNKNRYRYLIIDIDKSMDLEENGKWWKVSKKKDGVNLI